MVVGAQDEDVYPLVAIAKSFGDYVTNFGIPSISTDCARLTVENVFNFPLFFDTWLVLTHISTA